MEKSSTVYFKTRKQQVHIACNLKNVPFQSDIDLFLNNISNHLGNIAYLYLSKKGKKNRPSSFINHEVNPRYPGQAETSVGAQALRMLKREQEGPTPLLGQQQISLRNSQRVRGSEDAAPGGVLVYYVQGSGYKLQFSKETKDQLQSKCR